MCTEDTSKAKLPPELAVYLLKNEYDSSLSWTPSSAPVAIPYVQVIDQFS